MPWKESNFMDERIKFVGRLLDGEKMARLCREFGISSKTGYKIFERYEQCGVQGLCDRSRRAYRQAHQLAYQVERTIVVVLFSRLIASPLVGLAFLAGSY